MNDPVVELTDASAAALQTFIASGVVLVCVLLSALSGSRLKLFRSILAFGSLVTASVAALFWCEGMSQILWGLGIPPSWSLAAGYTTILATVLSVMGVSFRLSVRAEIMNYVPLLDRLGGALVGAVAGVVLASVVRVGFAMTPFPAAARPTPDQFQIDATPRILRMVASTLTSDPNVRRSWLRGGGTPLQGNAPPEGQPVWSEPYLDLNSNDYRDADEPFLDKDGNYEFSPDFATTEAAAGPEMKIGVMDRYWLGNWRLVRVMESTAGEAAPEEDPANNAEDADQESRPPEDSQSGGSA
jgi:hypothetical protein